MWVVETILSSETPPAEILPAEIQLTEILPAEIQPAEIDSSISIDSSIGPNIIPHIFVGTATIDGAPAPDETVITAWVAVTDAFTSVITFGAIDGNPNTAFEAITIIVPAEQAQIGASVVTGGMYSIMTNQLSSGSHNGKAVSFRTGDRVAGQSQVWTSGRADELNLTWGGPLLLGFDHGICC